MRSAYEGRVNARHIYLVSHLNSKIIRARETAFFRSAPLFGNPLPYGKGEFAALYNLCALRSAAKRGKPFGCPLKLTKKCADNSAHFFVNKINLLRHAFLHGYRDGTNKLTMSRSP